MLHLVMNPLQVAAFALQKPGRIKHLNQKQMMHCCRSPELQIVCVCVSVSVNITNEWI